jgi:restriction endonuclease S subunit
LTLGTSLNFLSLAELRQLKVPLPSLDLQDKIVDLDRLRSQEQKLYQQLSFKRNQLFNALTMQFLTNNQE